MRLLREEAAHNAPCSVTRNHYVAQASENHEPHRSAAVPGALGMHKEETKNEGGFQQKYENSVLSVYVCKYKGNLTSQFCSHRRTGRGWPRATPSRSL